jgi:hypothetical protein
LTATIMEHYQRFQTQRKNAGRPSCLADAVWQHLHEFP